MQSGLFQGLQAADATVGSRMPLKVLRQHVLQSHVLPEEAHGREFHEMTTT